MLNNKILAETLSMLPEILKFNIPTDKILSNYFKQNNKLTNQQRNIIADIIYGILRNYYKISKVVKINDYPRVLGVFCLKLAKFDEITELRKQFMTIPWDDLDKIEFHNDDSSITELPQWLTERLVKQLGREEFYRLAKSLNQEASLDLRVNTLKENVANVKNILQADGIIASNMPYSPYGLRIDGRVNLLKHALYKNGSIEIQDESSQLATMLLSPKRGAMVVDFCAGSGGKTLMLATLMRDSGRIFALDINEKRLDNIYPRIERSGLTNIYPQLISHLDDIKVKRMHGKMDSVFVDAPCSGLGTLRRNPDLKFRQNEATITELRAKQLAILTAASKLVKNGGDLVYATCSILDCENQDIIVKFLEQNVAFEIIPIGEWLKTSNNLVLVDNKFLSLLPHIHHTDGFFAVKLRKKIK